MDSNYFYIHLMIKKSDDYHYRCKYFNQRISIILTFCALYPNFFKVDFFNKPMYNSTNFKQEGQNNIMEKVKYNIAVQTYMEVFDYLINNDLFIFDADKDFLKSRIRIGEYGFIKETQAVRGVWDAKNDQKVLVPAIYVLNVLTTYIDDILRSGRVPVSPTSDYAYIHDTASKLSGQRTYYQSYQTLLQSLVDVKRAQEQAQYYDDKVLNFHLFKLRDLARTLSRLSPLEKRTMECYAKLEEELTGNTAALLMIDEDGYPVEDFRKELYFSGAYPLRFASNDTYVDWDAFKSHIVNYYEFQREKKFDMHGVYSPFDTNPYISDLGLDGLTK